MRCTQGGTARTRSPGGVVAALLGATFFTFAACGLAIAADDGFVTASDAPADADYLDVGADPAGPRVPVTRRVNYVNGPEMPLPPPPAGADGEFDMSPGEDPALRPIHPAGSERGGSHEWVPGHHTAGADHRGSCDECGAAGEDCGCESCGPSEKFPCGPPGRVWVRAEYLQWWTKGMNTPPLVTTSPSDTDRLDAGVLDSPYTHILFGGDRLLKENRSGGRLRFGLWLDRCYTHGIEGDLFALENSDESFFGTSRLGYPILARPFFNPLIGAEDAELVGFPDVIEGDVGVEAENSFSSAGLRWRCNLCCTERECAPPCRQPSCNFCYLPGGTIRLDFLLGYRFMRFDESLLIFEDLNAYPIDNQFQIFDYFDTETEFHGVDVGFAYEYHRCRWSLELLAKVAIGNNRQEVMIDGGTRISAGDISDTFGGGILAQHTNMGNFERNKFGVIPEVGVTLGYRVTDCVKLTLGYSFIYWSNVLRPGEQIDRVVNPGLFPPQEASVYGPPRPAFFFRDTDFWAQGLSWGLEMRW